MEDMTEAFNLEKEAQALLTEIRDQGNEIFDSWSRDILAGIRDHSLRYKSISRLTRHISQLNTVYSTLKYTNV